MRDNFVPAHPPGEAPAQHRLPVAQVLPPDAPVAHLDVTPAAQTIIQQRDTELTRARATAIFSLPLALGLAVAITAAVVALADAPVLSALTLVAFFLAFCLVWLCAFVFHVARSPGGIAYMHTRRMWRIIEREQRHRHAAYWYHVRRGGTNERERHG